VFGLDEVISGLAHGSNPWFVLVVALLLGLRHATDPDHVVAVSTLVAIEPERRVPRAGILGAAWGAGHASAVLAVGLPFVPLALLLPQPVQSMALLSAGLGLALGARRVQSGFGRLAPRAGRLDLPLRRGLRGRRSRGSRVTAPRFTAQVAGSPHSGLIPSRRSRELRVAAARQVTEAWL
jgi:hypothetical protein